MQIAMFAPKDDENGRFYVEAASSSDEKSGVEWDVLRITCPDGYLTLYIETPAQAKALVEAVTDLEGRVNERYPVQWEKCRCFGGCEMAEVEPDGSLVHPVLTES